MTVCPDCGDVAPFCRFCGTELALVKAGHYGTSAVHEWRCPAMDATPLVGHRPGATLFDRPAPGRVYL